MEYFIFEFNSSGGKRILFGKYRQDRFSGSVTRPLRAAPLDRSIVHGRPCAKAWKSSWNIWFGSYRRLGVGQPFANWTLICDENLKTMKKVCNITQSIVDSEGQFAFSWSLAATEGGKPMMILRTRAELGEGKPVALNFPGRKEPVATLTDACDANVCVTYLPVGPVLREQIAKEANAQVSYKDTAETTIVFEAPLKGLSATLAAIK